MVHRRVIHTVFAGEDCGIVCKDATQDDLGEDPRMRGMDGVWRVTEGVSKAIVGMGF